MKNYLIMLLSLFSLTVGITACESPAEDPEPQVKIVLPTPAPDCVVSAVARSVLDQTDAQILNGPAAPATRKTTAWEGGQAISTYIGLCQIGYNLMAFPGKYGIGNSRSTPGKPSIHNTSASALTHFRASLLSCLCGV